MKLKEENYGWSIDQGEEIGTRSVRGSLSKPFGQEGEVRGGGGSQIMLSIARQGEGFGFCSKSKARAGSILCCKKITFTATWRGGGGEVKMK